LSTLKFNILNQFYNRAVSHKKLQANVRRIIENNQFMAYNFIVEYLDKSCRHIERMYISVSAKITREYLLNCKWIINKMK